MPCAALKFKKERGRLPSINSQDAWEKRMAEGAAAFMRFKKEGPLWLTSILTRLRAELDELRAAGEKGRAVRAREERIIAGFEEIQRLSIQHGRAPQHGEGRDIFERLYAVRLDRLRALEECRALLTPLTVKGCWLAQDCAGRAVDDMDDDELLAELGRGHGASDITELTPCALRCR